MKNLEDLESDGFVIWNEAFSKPVKGDPVEINPKIVVVDTKEVLSAVQATNLIVKTGIENSNRQLQASIDKLVNSMAKKPESFTLDIKRDQRGFMTSIDVKINN